MSESFDVGVIGAGPAGSTMAGLLAQKGWRVVVFEKDQFPRFHIGESLLPHAIPVLQKLGLELDAAPFALKKAGARFVAEDEGKNFRFDFRNTLPGCFPHAYQVDRAAFDLALAQRAQAHGAEVRFGQAVSGWEEQEGAVRVFGTWGETTCRYLVDASGQQSLMSRAQRTKDRVRGLGKLGTFTHYENVRSSAAQDVFAQGDILIMLTRNEGWGWAIPLAGNRLSVGVVLKDGQPVVPAEEAMRDYLSSPLLKQVLEGATQSAPLRRIADYSYYNRAPSTPRVASLGDARAFLDPVFSSGITLAVFTAQELAGKVAAALSAGLPLDLEAFHAEMGRGYQTFQRIIERFYRPGWARRTFFLEDKAEDLIQQVTTVLAGDVWRHDNPFQNKLLAGNRSAVWFEDVQDSGAQYSESACSS